MFRDFSDSAKAKLLGYVEDVTETSVWGKIGDAIGDTTATVRSWFGYLNIDNYVDNLDEYHSKVIDKNDITAQQIEAIFADVKSVDTRYGSGMAGIDETTEKVALLIQELASTINPSGGNLDMSACSALLQSRVEDMLESKATLEDTVDEQMLGVAPEGAQLSADPVNLSTGNFIYEHGDLYIDGEIPMAFHRYYNSRESKISTLGKCFRHNYDFALKKKNEGIDVIMSDGQRRIFHLTDDSQYIGETTVAETLVKIEEKYIYTHADSSEIIFDLEGRIIRLNKNNRGIAFLYDESGKLIQALSDNGDYLSYEYNEDGYISAVEDSSLRRVSIEYRDKYLVSVKIPEDISLEYKYMINGRISEIINSQKIAVVKNTYDKQFRVIKQIFPDGGEMYFEYNDTLREVTQTERNGSKTVFFHDELYRNTKILYEDMTSEKFVYNNRNQCIVKTDRLGNTTRMAYDNRGNRTQIITPNKKRISMTYDKNNQLLNLSINGKRRIKNTYSNGNLICTEDAQGQKNENVYDRDGRISKILVNGLAFENYIYDKKGNKNIIDNVHRGKCESVFDELNRITCFKDAYNNEEQYVYDDLGNIIKVINSEGLERYYTYNSNGKPTEIMDFDGYKLTMKYDDMGRLISETDKENNVTTYTYDTMWNVTEIKYPNNGIKRFVYDNENNIVKVVLPEGGEFFYSYDSLGNRTSISNSDGEKTQYEYNAENQLIKVIEDENIITTFDYDVEGNLVQVTDALGYTSTFTYDILGNRTSYTDENGFTTYMEYGKNGEITSVVFPNGGVRKYLYDQYSRLIGKEEPNGLLEKYKYDLNGNMVERKNNTGNSVGFEYDCMNRISKVINALGGIRRYTYDELGHITTILDENNNLTSYEYSPNGNLAKVIAADGSVTEYEYNSSGEISKIAKNGNDINQETKFEWNLLGEIKKIINPIGEVEEYIYNQCGKLLKKIDQEGYETSYLYNSFGKIAEIAYDSKKQVEFSYNKVKKLEKISDWNGTTVIDLDPKGMPLSIQDTQGEKIQYEWGSMGEKTKLTYSNGESVSYVYNNANQLKEMIINDQKTQYEYDEYGRFLSRTTPNDLKMEYKYNEQGRISDIINYSEENIIESFSYRYDKGGNKTQTVKKRPNYLNDSGRFDYSFDGLNRLVLVSKDGVDQKKYEYDLFGNRVTKNDYSNQLTTEYSYDRNNQLTNTRNQIEEYSYEYDKRGNIKKVYKDANLHQEFEFDTCNKMSAFNTVSPTGNTLSAKYYYNGLGKRIGKTIEKGEKSNEIKYLLDLTRVSHNVLGEKDLSNHSEKYYYYDGKVMGMKSREDVSYFLSDDHGSPTVVDEEDSRKYYMYDEFGMSEYNDYSVQPFGYTGYMYDAECELYYAQARMYQSSTGRYVSEDKVRGMIYQPITLNRYVYCFNKPEDFVDEDGEWPTVVVGAIVGGLVSGAVSVATQVIDSVQEGNSVLESFSEVDYKEVAIDAGKGAIKGAIAGTGAGLIVLASSSAVVDMAGDVAKQTIVEGNSFSDVDKSQVITTGVVSFGLSLTVGIVSSKVSSAINKKMGLASMDTLQNTEGAINELSRQLQQAKAQSRINKLTARVADRTVDFLKESVSYLGSKMVSGVISVIEYGVYKKGLSQWLKDGINSFFECGLAV